MAAMTDRREWILAAAGKPVPRGFAVEFGTGRVLPVASAGKKFGSKRPPRKGG